MKTASGESELDHFMLLAVAIPFLEKAICRNLMNRTLTMQADFASSFPQAPAEDPEGKWPGARDRQRPLYALTDRKFPQIQDLSKIRMT